MSLQTTFKENIGSAFAGQWYDISDTDAISRAVELSAVPFGVAVVSGTHNNQCRLPDHGGYFKSKDSSKTVTTPTDNRFAGITMYHVPLPRAAGEKLTKPVGDGDMGYLGVTELASLATHGRIYVICESDTKQGGPVFFRHTLADNAEAPQTQQLGMLSSTDDATTQRIAGAEWLYTQAAGGLNVVKLTGATQSDPAAAPATT